MGINNSILPKETTKVSLKVAAIAGMCGSGKTNLAHEVYNEKYHHRDRVLLHIFLSNMRSSKYISVLALEPLDSDGRKPVRDGGQGWPVRGPGANRVEEGWNKVEGGLY